MGRLGQGGADPQQADGTLTASGGVSPRACESVHVFAGKHEGVTFFCLGRGDDRFPSLPSAHPLSRLATCSLVSSRFTGLLALKLSSPGEVGAICLSFQVTKTTHWVEGS